jgi:hypothetical protein
LRNRVTVGEAQPLRMNMTQFICLAYQAIVTTLQMHFFCSDLPMFLIPMHKFGSQTLLQTAMSSSILIIPHKFRVALRT